MLTLFYLVNLNKLIIMKNLCVTTLTFLLIFGACKKRIPKNQVVIRQVAQEQNPI